MMPVRFSWDVGLKKTRPILLNFMTNKTNNCKVGLTALINRFYVLNGQIPLQWRGFETFRVKCKKTASELVNVINADNDPE